MLLVLVSVGALALARQSLGKKFVLLDTRLEAASEQVPLDVEVPGVYAITIVFGKTSQSYDPRGEWAIHGPDGIRASGVIEKAIHYSRRPGVQFKLGSFKAERESLELSVKGLQVGGGEPSLRIVMDSSDHALHFKRGFRLMLFALVAGTLGIASGLTSAVLWVRRRRIVRS